MSISPDHESFCVQLTDVLVCSVLKHFLTDRQYLNGFLSIKLNAYNFDNLILVLYCLTFYTHARACMHTYIHTHIHTYIHTYTHTHTFMYRCMHTYIHTYVHECMHTCIHTHTSTHMHIYIHTYTYIQHVYIHPHIHTHTYIHTYIQHTSFYGSMESDVVKNYSDSEYGNPLAPLHGLLFPISSKGSFICTIPGTR